MLTLPVMMFLLVLPVVDAVPRGAWGVAAPPPTALRPRPSSGQGGVAGPPDHDDSVWGLCEDTSDGEGVASLGQYPANPGPIQYQCGLTLSVSEILINSL